MNETHDLFSSGPVLTNVSTGTYKNALQMDAAISELESSAPGLMAVLWYDNTVAVAYIHGGIQCGPGVKVDADHLVEARVFNGDLELHAWKDSAGLYRWRLRTDGSDTLGAVVESTTVNQYLWGTTATPIESGWSILSEERGFRLVLPVDVPAGAVDTMHRLALKVRYYVGFNSDHQAGYVDSRFVAFLAYPGTEREITLCRTKE